VAEALQVRRAVDLGGLEDLAGDGREAGEHDQRDQRRPLPHVHQRHRQKRGRRGPEDVAGVEPGLLQHPGVEPVGRVGQEAAEQPDDDRGHEHRHEDQREREVLAPDELMDEQGDRDPEPELQPDGEHEVQNAAYPARADCGVGEQPRPVVEPDEVERDAADQPDR
jgi:hypothetical protein